MNHNINIKNILDAIARSSERWPEIQKLTLDDYLFRYLARLTPVVKDLPVRLKNLKGYQRKSLLSAKLHQWIVSLSSRNANVHFWFRCILCSENVTRHDLMANNFIHHGRHACESRYFVDIDESTVPNAFDISSYSWEYPPHFVSNFR